jgi:hypothetical protein
MIVSTNAMIHRTMPAVAMPLLPLLLPFIPSINPTIVTGYPINGSNHAKAPIIPKVSDAIDFPLVSCCLWIDI